MKLMRMDELTEKCGFFYEDDVNNGYACCSPDQEEREHGIGCCFRHFCPVAYPATVEDLKKHGLSEDDYEEEYMMVDENLMEAKKLWAELEDVPMDCKTECMDAPFLHFPAGTHREEIWHWFEDKFNISVAKDLMGF